MTAAGDNKLFKVAKHLNLGKDEIVDFLKTKGLTVENKPTTLLNDEMLAVVMEKFSKEAKQVEKQREKIEKHKVVARKSDAAVSLKSREQDRIAEIDARELQERSERDRIEKARLEIEAAEPWALLPESNGPADINGHEQSNHDEQRRQNDQEYQRRAKIQRTFHQPVALI